MTARRAPACSAWAVAAALLAWFAATAWARPLMLPDEGRYVGVAWEMLRSGDWLTPTLNGLPYFHKPPLFYWITAASLGVFGHHEWAARTAPIVGATLAALSTFLFVRRWGDPRTARLTLVVLAVQPLFFIGGQFANLDMLVAGCITATITLLAHAVLSTPRPVASRQAPRGSHGNAGATRRFLASIDAQTPARRVLWAAYAMAAVGVLAKGLIGVVIPALVIAVWLLATRRWRTLLALLSPVGVLIFVLVAAPWFVAMQARFPGFLHYFFVVQHFQRFAAGGFNNAQPFWFYFALLTVFFLPWLAWLVAGLRRAPPAAALRLLMMVWVAVVLVFFSLPQSKLVGYVLPAVPPLAVLVAGGWAVAAGIMLALGLGSIVGLTLKAPKSSREIASVLAAHRQRGEPVVMIEQYAFDLPFYARLEAPVTVLDDWHGVDLRQRDNWRQELADAGGFAPARARAAMQDEAAVVRQLCAHTTSWAIGNDKAAARYPVLAAATRVQTIGADTLWRVDGSRMANVSARPCSGTPSAG